MAVFFVFTIPLSLFWLFDFLAHLREVLSSPTDWPLLLADWVSLIPYLFGISLLGFIAAVSGIACWITWIAPRPAPDDLWGYSDLVGYEDESPRDIQARIDTLRAQLVREREH
jgi:hypothetical protein